MEFDEEEFKRKYPHLYEELGDSALEGTEDSESPEVQHDEPHVSETYPNEVISYIRRARTDDEAIEIVDYMRRRGEISESDATKILKQIRDQGVRSFGRLKTWGHYERELRKKIVEIQDDGKVEEGSD